LRRARPPRFHPAAERARGQAVANLDGLMDDRKVNPHEAPTELGIVWYAANYYYEASYRAGREYGGLVFRRPSGAWSVTLRKGSFDTLAWQDIGKDMPAGCWPAAYWHTHLPASAYKGGSGAGLLLGLNDILGALVGQGYTDFSEGDLKSARQAAKVLGRPFAIYLCTATLIKRWHSGKANNPQVWAKDPPSRMAHMFTTSPAGR
jgi:hypothetical protein